MLARVVENVYWLARYLERAENTARLVSVNTNLLLDLPKGLAPGWQPLIDITGSKDTVAVFDRGRFDRMIDQFPKGTANPCVGSPDYKHFPELEALKR